MSGVDGMTVGELIAFLQTCPEDAEVEVYDSYQRYIALSDVWYEQEQNTVKIC